MEHPQQRHLAVTVSVALVAAGFAGFALMRALGLERGPLLVPLTAHTPVALGAAALAAATAGVLRRWGSLAALAAVVAVLAVAVLPRAIPYGITAAGGPVLRVMSFNALGGGAHVREVVDLVREQEVDVLALQEVTPRLLADLAAAGLEDLLPHAVDHSAMSGVEGSSVHSSLPLADLGDAAEGPGAFAMPVAGVAVDGPGPAVEVVSVHVPPPLGASLTAAWERELRALAVPAEQDTVRILAGDFNATVDHAALRAVLDSGYVDAASVLGRGLRATWPTDRPLPGVAIDHVLVTPDAGVDRLEVVEVTGSDHRAVVVDVSLPGAPR